MKWKKPMCILLIFILILSTTMISVGGAPPLTKLFVDPPTYTATTLGEEFTININITNVTDLLAFDLKLGYNTTLLDALDAEIGSFPQPIDWGTTEIHEQDGYVLVSVISEQAADGNGTLATITFNTTYAGSASCTLDLYDTELYDSTAGPITHDIEDGNYKFAILTITVTTDKPVYTPGENVQIHGNITVDDSPYEGLIALEVDDPGNYGKVRRTLQIGPPPTPGNITIIDVVPCNMWGDPKESFSTGTIAYFNVTVRNNGTQWIDAAVTINAYDGGMVPLGAPTALTPLGPGTHSGFIAPIYIPTWAYTGTGKVYASVFTDLPRDGGVPLCPEKSANFTITNGEGGTPPPETQTGNFTLTFKLSPNAGSGIYRVYASACYRKQYAMDNTVFGVNVICVPDDYSSIQAAVDAANPGDIILVASGTYNEHVAINKSLTLIGIHPTTTIINGSGTETVVTVIGDNVEISRFTIQNGGSFPESGITLNNSSDSKISENIITSNNGCGINVNSSNNTAIIDNTLSNNNYGIYLNHSTNATLRDNNMICNKYNIGVFGDSIPDFIHSIDITNKVDGKPIIYWINQSDKTVPTNAGFVAIVNSTNITIRRLNITKNGQGVLLAFTNDSLIERVNTTSNEYGIYLYNSVGNTLANNTMSCNKYNFGLYGAVGTHFNNTIDKSNTVDGKPVYYVKKESNTVYNSSTNAGTFYLIDCTNVTLSNLTLTKNVNGIFFWNTTQSNIQNVTASKNLNGIHLDSSDNNTIYHNSFVENTIQAKITESYNNVWDDGYPSGGNYWSEYINIDSQRGPYQNETGNDGIWDQEYVINANNTDNYPLISPLAPPVYNIDTHLGYTAIQEAIDAPQTLNWHTIIVRTGTYYEHVTINKSLTLIGIIGSTVIDGSGTGTVVNITANQVTLRGFIIQRSGSSTTDQGILIFYSNNTFIRDSSIIENKNGVWIHHCYSCRICGNNIENNTGTGIHIESSSGNYIQGNKVAYNGVGIKLISSNDNEICHNNFINNTQQLYNYNSANTWDDGEGKGNYWSDYNGTDLDDPPDGVGDEYLPWQGVDWYPLINSWTPRHNIAITSITAIIPHNVTDVYPWWGWEVDLIITIKNKGDFTEFFLNITAYYDENPIQTKIITEIPPMTEMVINITWDPVGVPWCHNYTISAYVQPVPDEANTTDNTFVDGKIRVRLTGDVNNSGRVGADDKILVGKALFTRPGHPKYNPYADVNNSGRIGADDMILVGKYLFKRCY